jgi:hypothetical protein
VERADLDRYLFDPEDIIVVVGQDGLVANVAKYVIAQPVIGVNPEPNRHHGVLVTHESSQVQALLAALVQGRAGVERRTLVTAEIDDRQSLSALNEIYLGHPSHQSARYRLLEPTGSAERQSSSGVIDRYRRNRLVRFLCTGATQSCRPARTDGASPGLVRARGMAFAGHRHVSHRRPAHARRAVTDHGRIRSTCGLRRRTRGRSSDRHVGSGGRYRRREICSPSRDELTRSAHELSLTIATVLIT